MQDGGTSSLPSFFRPRRSVRILYSSKNGLIFVGNFAIHRVEPQIFPRSAPELPWCRDHPT